MRLTKYDREAFVLAAMDDVPQINYDEQAKKLVLDHLKEVLPVDLQNAIANLVADLMAAGWPKGKENAQPAAG